MVFVAGVLLGATPSLAQDISVKIGVLNDQSGIYSDLSGVGSVVAAQLAVEDFDGASKGISVEILSADHQNKPDVGSSIARSWIDQEDVDVIADVPGSAIALAVSDIVEDKGRIHLNSGAGTAELTGAECSPNAIHWTYDTWALANGTGRAMVQQGGDTWFFISADYAFGHAMEQDTSAVVEATGGQVLGSARHPLGTNDFASFLLQAQSSGAKVIGLANGGGDMINAVKQASEFGITQSGQSLAALVAFISDVHSLGLQTAQGLVLTEAFYWDQNDESRAWSERFGALHEGKMPTQVHAGVYSSIMHYLKAVEAAGTKDADAVMAKMKEMPIDDPLFGQGEVRVDGRAVHDMYLFRVKSPEDSTGEWDVYETLATIPASEAFRPLADSDCPLVQ
ncbi:ABC transporter substrate-binding protein [uncultured Paracoccus sp.]|uniref:ABC transporter substrate-binding protein n=1 Tax=uncultured Paracoccus sp. TaxID=189685 RepID=UPI00261FFBDD|nr:ABC transporter substrate-binding protein [uncultured Paracoccus sp.]